MSSTHFTHYQLPDARIGAVHLRVTNLDRALAIYRDLLGLHVIDQAAQTVRLSPTGTEPALIVLSAPPDAVRRAPGTTGLFHVALRLPTRQALARLFQRLLAAQFPLQGAADHGVSEALYLADLDGNGLELTADRPRDAWPWQAGAGHAQLAMVTDPLAAADLLAQADSAPWDGIDPGTDVGHIHLQVRDLGRAEAFYNGVLGLDVMQRSYAGALFVAAGGYHHHVGLNTWAGPNASAPPPNAAGLVAYDLVVPDAWALQSIVAQAEAAGLDPATGRNGRPRVTLTDPDGHTLHVVAETA